MKDSIISDLLIESEDFPKLRSTIVMGLKTSRKLAGRDIHMGTPLNGSLCADMKGDLVETVGYASVVLLALTSYLILLESLGSVFQLKSATKSDLSKDGINSALKQFSSLSENDISVISDLRNCLAHKMSIGNSSRIFSISENYGEMITHPQEKKEWPSENRIRDEVYTEVNSVEVCQLVEGVFLAILKAHGRGKVRLRNTVSIDLLKAQYFIGGGNPKEKNPKCD